ncbi:hypothetical protein VaNZ11_001731, partial [Volvox africanus]
MTCTATIIRSGHAMPPGRVSVSRRLGQAQATIRRGMQDVGGILVGDDNRLYGAVFPGFPLGVSRIRPYSVTSAFPLLCGSMSMSGHNLHASLHASVHATANSAGASKAAAAQSGSVSRASVVCHFLPVENGSCPPSPPRRKGGLSSTSGDDGDKGKHPFASQGWLQHVQPLMVGVTICVGIGLILFICLPTVGRELGVDSTKVAFPEGSLGLPGAAAAFGRDAAYKAADTSVIITDKVCNTLLSIADMASTIPDKTSTSADKTSTIADKAADTSVIITDKVCSTLLSIADTASTIADKTTYTVDTIAEKASNTVINSIKVIVGGVVVYKVIDVFFKGGGSGPP